MYAFTQETAQVSPLTRQMMWKSGGRPPMEAHKLTAVRFAQGQQRDAKEGIDSFQKSARIYR